MRRVVIGEFPLEGLVPTILMSGNLLDAADLTVSVERYSSPLSSGEERGELLVRSHHARPSSNRGERTRFEDPTLAGVLLKACVHKVLLRRYKLPSSGVLEVYDWENEGLRILEGELPGSAPAEGYSVGRDVSREDAFSLWWLAQRPWSRWAPEVRAFWQQGV